MCVCVCVCARARVRACMEDDQLHCHGVCFLLYVSVLGAFFTVFLGPRKSCGRKSLSLPPSLAGEGKREDMC